MRRTNSATLLALGLAAIHLATAGCTTNGESGSQKATLDFTGASGTRFWGSCAVGDDEPEELSGQVPQSRTYELNGRRLECEISSEGQVRVALTVGENARSVQQMSGGTLNLSYGNGSISSSTSSSDDSSSSGSSGRGSSYSSRGDMTTEPRNVSGFDEVELSGVGNLYIQQTGSESLTVEAQADVIPKLRTEVEGNRLIIGPEPDTSVHTNRPINYELTAKDLNALEVSGTGNVDAEDISTDKLSVAISGAGGVQATGRADSQDIKILGSGDYRAGDLESKKVKIDVGGSGSAIVKVSDELDAEVSGSGSVRYIGNPMVNQHVSGAGRVSEH